MLFLRSSLKDSRDPHANVGAGAKFCDDGWKHMAEAVFHLPSEDKDGNKEAFKGVFGQPVTLKYGCDWTMSKNTEFRHSCAINSNVDCHNVIEHKIDANYTGRAHHHFSGAKNKVDVGFELSYKL